MNFKFCIDIESNQFNVLLNFPLQLILSGLRLTRIPEAVINLYRDEKIIHLDLSFNKLKSIEGISLFKHLESLVLDNNNLSMIGGGFDEFSRPVRLVNSKLRVMSLNNNRIINLDAFLRNISICFPNLTYLSLLRNPCCPNDLSSKWNILSPLLGADQYDDFRTKCTTALPRLKFLDSTNLERSRQMKLRSQASLELPFRQQIMDNLIKYTNGLVEVFTEDRISGAPLSPLPANTRNPGDHHGMYSRNCVEYIGKQSEGNRFIGNGQL